MSRPQLVSLYQEFAVPKAQRGEQANGVNAMGANQTTHQSHEMLQNSKRRMRDVITGPTTNSPPPKSMRLTNRSDNSNFSYNSNRSTNNESSHSLKRLHSTVCS